MSQNFVFIFSSTPMVTSPAAIGMLLEIFLRLTELSNDAQSWKISSGMPVSIIDTLAACQLPDCVNNFNH
jgi:hypothetical protein